MINPQITTEQDMIQQVAGRWAQQYAHTKDPSRLATLEALRSMNLSTATAKTVAEIIGNETWTRLGCDQCGEYTKWLVTVGAPRDWESPTASLCRDCFNKAVAVVKAYDDSHQIPIA